MSLNQILKNQCELPDIALKIIRYHSLYPWHRDNAYLNYCSNDDFKVLKWVNVFNKYDLYTKTDETLNNENWIMYAYEKCCINSHAFILRSNEKITQNYLYFWLDQDFMKEIIQRAGMRAAQPGINQVNVNELVILIPDTSVIEKFESQITSSIDKIFANAVQNRKLAEIRDWLLPMLMNGQVQVR